MTTTCCNCNKEFTLKVDAMIQSNSTVIVNYNQYSPYHDQVIIRCPHCNHHEVLYDRIEHKRMM